ncbi:hypothetical protein M407DRAFT_222116 [Tulasnella calospora MUT 4182]|uniref:Polysaccharide lyase family 14 protein n=1 Tax=Tulasnella calospora MUT 4182 TaxID=1051891 RepID=A0A0C3KED4_9AGAM|nr:hypothetical protein M407DRAFT_222116 [Tulasnella calospora MUT 4182]
MTRAQYFLLTIGLLHHALGRPDTSYHEISKRATVPDLGFYSPLAVDGGNMLTQIPETFPAGQGEPLNVIISGKSDPLILSSSPQDNGGLFNYFLSLSFGTSCGGGINLGDKQSANLGDGQGYVNETVVMRYNYGDPVRGTCNETQLGGNHFRFWRQSGSAANSSAVFLAVSYELSLEQQHDIAVNGYNLGRDWLVGNATSNAFANPNPLSTQASTTASGPAIIPSASYTGSTTANGWTYQTTATYVTGLLQATSAGINHNSTVEEDGRPALDGLVALLTVSITARNE